MNDHNIVAATRAGGARNQDRYVIGNDFAAVLDGATSYAATRIDAGQYAEVLGQALRSTVTSGATLAESVTQAIKVIVDERHLAAEKAPTSTVAIVRWNPHTVDVYVLGDTTVALLGVDGSETVLTDTRLKNIAKRQRTIAATHLRNGFGYDATHRRLLQDIQIHEARQRNQDGGYWIAGAQPDAAAHGLTFSVPRSSVHGAVIASDGVANSTEQWRGLFNAARTDPAAILQQIHDRETADPDGRRLPRSKPHDDKTLVVVSL